MLPSRRAVPALAVALLAALAGVLLPAAAAVRTAHAASAEERTVQGGRLDWGVKSSFQRYVTGPIAGGSWSLTGGAATVGGSQFRFHSARGSYDPATGAFTAAFSGGVHFIGHRTSDGSHELDLTISRPTVRISGGRGTLHADMVSKAKSTGKVASSAQVPLASLNLSGVNMKGGASPVRLTGIPATLTTQGAQAFAGYYTAGTPLDPVSLSVDVVSGGGADPKPESTPGAKPKPEPEASAGPSAAAGSSAAGFRAAAVDWGVRRTFREYVTGPIAQGKWTLSGGAQDGGALFRFPRGKGVYDPEKQTLDASFAGAVRFTGKHLDLTLTGIAVRVGEGGGTLLADVVHEGATDKAVPLVTFEAQDFTPENGLAALSEAPAVLTERGARAFGGIYRAGTAMDPVSLAVAVTDGARLPALPDLGSDTAAPTPDASADSTAAAPATSPPTGAYLAAGAGALAAVAAAAYAAIRRRRRASPRTADPADSRPDRPT